MAAVALPPILKQVLKLVKSKSNKDFSTLQFGGQTYASTLVNIKEYKYINLYLRNITEKKQTEQALIESYKKNEKVLEETIKTLASIVEIKDPYTSGHQEKVTEIATLIAIEMGLEQDRVSAVRTAASIHDIGKINIPASILSKPGKVSEIEYNMIKTHPEASYNMIKNIEFSWPVANIVLQHHERINGSGYPQNLKGSDILLEAKILAVADVLEAMNSHRPYRPSLGLDKAIRELEENKAILYDAGIVDICIKLVNREVINFAK